MVTYSWRLLSPTVVVVPSIQDWPPTKFCHLVGFAAAELHIDSEDARASVLVTADVVMVVLSVASKLMYTVSFR